jgi:magnesium chelatase subunit D
VELPIGATEDRLLGSLDLEQALGGGRVAYTPGLLAAAHRGALYVDEVNLLPDHLVDALLDAAAMGEAHVERDGVSLRHAAKFLLVGTMNPEEGELRPQLLDRFGLTVQVSAPREPADRVEVIRRRLAYETAPETFAQLWAAEDAALAARIVEARKRLVEVEIPEAELLRIAHVCATFDVDGLRADLVVARAAVALAAWEARTEVTAEDIKIAARLALPHRCRRNPFDAPGLDEQVLEDALANPPTTSQDPDDDPDGGGPGNPAGGHPNAGDQTNSGGSSSPRSDQTAGSGAADGQGSAGEQRHGEGRPYRARLLSVPGTGRGEAGRRSVAYTRNGRITPTSAGTRWA